MIDNKIIERLIIEQKNRCAACWRTFDKYPYHVHHAIYGREKKFAKWLDMPENLFLVCPDCHSRHGYLSCYFARCCAWTDKVNAGYQMDKWHDSIPMLIKDNFLYLKKPKGKDAMLMWDIAERNSGKGDEWQRRPGLK